MSDNNKNVAYKDFFTVGRTHPLLSGLERSVLNEHEQKCAIKAIYDKNAFRDLRSVLEVFEKGQDPGAYIEYARSLQGFRHEQSSIASTYNHESDLNGVKNQALGSAEARASIDQALSFAMKRIKAQQLDTDSPSFTGYWAEAVASDTVIIINRFVCDLFQRINKPGYRKLEFRPAIASDVSSRLPKFIETQRPTEAMFKRYIIPTLHHILLRRKQDQEKQKSTRSGYDDWYYQR